MLDVMDKLNQMDMMDPLNQTLLAVRQSETAGSSATSDANIESHYNVLSLRTTDECLKTPLQKVLTKRLYKESLQNAFAFTLADCTCTCTCKVPLQNTSTKRPFFVQ